MTQKFISRIKGLIPLIDRKQSAEPYVVEGKNFVITAQGPVSGLGRELVSYKGIDQPVNVQFFEVSETIESFIFTDEGIFRLDTETQKLNCLYKFTFRLDSQYPFTKAAVGNRYYFVREGYPMIEYTIGTDSWVELSGGSIPLNIVACEESEGRLVVLTNLWIAWSAIGDGQDFVASQFTGAGAQAITKIGFSNSTPIALRKTPEGFLVFLSSGIIRGQAMQSLVPFRFTILSREHVPLNPFCLSTTTDQSIIILTTAGLFKTNGQTPELWQPIMGQYLRENIIPNLDLITNKNNPQLFFDYDNSWFIIALSENQTPYVFTKAYVLNLTLDDWGSLDTNFVTLAKIKILPLKFIGFSYGLLDTQGSIFIINNAKGVEKIPVLENGLFYHNEPEEMAGVINNAILRCTTKAYFRVISTEALNTTGLYNQWGENLEYLDPENLIAIEKDTVDDSGVLEFKANTVFAAGIIDIVTVVEAKQYDSLNSLITIGPFRLSDEQNHDMFSYINGLVLGMREGGAGETSEDWNSTLEYPTEITEDWLLLSGDEDWGDSPVGKVQFDVSMIPTKDAYRVVNPDNSTIKLVSHNDSNLVYSCYSNGIYHLIKIDATKEDANFYLKTIDMNINLGGHLL